MVCVDFVFSGITPLAAHRKSSSLVRGPNCCGFCRCVAGLFKQSSGLFRNGEPFSYVDSSLFMVHKASGSADSKCAKDLKSNSANRTQGLEENPPNDVVQIMQIWQHSPDLPAQATINHLQLVRSPL